MTFLNPEPIQGDAWYYGFTLYEFNNDEGFRFVVTHDGEWRLTKGRLRAWEYELIASGWLEDSDIPWDNSPAGRNQLTFFTASPSTGYAYKFYVNGVRVPEWVFFDSLTIEEYSRYRKYNLHVSRLTYSYENLCTVDAWEN